MKLSDITYQNTNTFEFLDPATGLSFDPKVELEILSTDSKEAKSNLIKAQRKVVESAKDETNLEDGKIKPEILEAIYKEVYLNGLLVGWKNINDENGKHLKVNEENIRAVMQNDKIADFVVEKSHKLGNFKRI